MNSVELAAYEFKPTPCAALGCFEKDLQFGLWVGPKLESFCLRHSTEAWAKEFAARRAVPSPTNAQAAVPPASTGFLSQTRLSGVLVSYRTHPHLQVPSVWTPTRMYPYPNHRRKLGLKGSYDHADATVVSWGKHPAPTGAGQ